MRWPWNDEGKARAHHIDAGASPGERGAFEIWRDDRGGYQRRIFK